MKCKDCACSDVCYYKAFNDVRAVKRRDDVEKVCKSFIYRDRVKVDAVEVIRCKDCRFYEKETVSCSFVTTDTNWYEEDFCSYGEKRGDSQ